jgi:hypothetical protein
VNGPEYAIGLVSVELLEMRYSLPYEVPLFGMNTLSVNSGFASLYTNPLSSRVPEKVEDMETVVIGLLDAEANG